MNQAAIFRFRAAMVGALMIAAHTPPALADSPEALTPREILQARSPEWGQRGSGPLCGVYSACSALKMIGIDCSPAEFVATRYIGRCQGSTPLELAAIIEDKGARAAILERLSLLDVRRLEHPVIVNIRSTPGSRQYDHWAVVTFDERGVLLHDGPRAPARIQPAEFLGLWNGLGIIVSKENVGLSSVVWIGRLLLLQVAVLAALLLRLAIRWLPTHRGNLPLELLVIGTAACLLFLVTNAVTGDPRNHLAGARIAAAPFQNDSFAIGTLDDARVTSKDPRRLLIDARYANDYQAGTIP